MCPISNNRLERTDDWVNNLSSLNKSKNKQVPFEIHQSELIIQNTFLNSQPRENKNKKKIILPRNTQKINFDPVLSKIQIENDLIHKLKNNL